MTTYEDWRRTNLAKKTVENLCDTIINGILNNRMQDYLTPERMKFFKDLYTESRKIHSELSAECERLLKELDEEVKKTF